MKPHKHAELIKAWSYGATIEVLLGSEWYTLTGYFCWYEDKTYRIKPEPEPVYRELVEDEIIQEGDELLCGWSGIWNPYIGSVGRNFSGLDAHLTRTTRPAPAPKPEVKPDSVLYCRVRNYNGNKTPIHNIVYSVPLYTTLNLKLTFDGTTNELKSAEAIK